MNQGDPNVLLGRIDPVCVRMRQISTWDDLDTAAFPKRYGRGHEPPKWLISSHRKNPPAGRL